MQLQTSLRALAMAAATLCTAGAAQATITFVTSAGAQPFPTATRDAFSDLALNSAQGLSLLRSAGDFRYILSSSYTDPTNSSLSVVPAAGTGAVSTGWYADSLVFTLLAPTYAWGGNFFGTNMLGEVASGALTLTVTDAQGTTRSQSIAGNSLTAFNGIVSDVPLRLVTLSMTAPATSVFASADNILLSAVPVPEPGSWALMLAGGAMMLSLSRRRRR